MTTQEFEGFVKKWRKTYAKRWLNPSYPFVGLAGETGEVLEWHKKAELRGDAKRNTQELLLELGDVMHYTAMIASDYGWSLERVMEENIKKLKGRG